jgi:RNA polymerase sigma factor (sigma-70 family)
VVVRDSPILSDNSFLPPLTHPSGERFGFSKVTDFFGISPGRVIVSNNHSLTNFLNNGFQGPDSDSTRAIAERVWNEIKNLVHSRAKSDRGFWTKFNPDDLIQEVLAKVMGTEIEWENRHAFFAYVHRTLAHLLIDDARRRDREAPFLPPGHSDPPDDSGRNQPYQMMEREETISKVREAIQRLGAEDPLAADAIMLYYFETNSPTEDRERAGVSPAENDSTSSRIAEQLGIKSSAFRKRLQRAREKLKKVLEGPGR